GVVVGVVNTGGSINWGAPALADGINSLAAAKVSPTSSVLYVSGESKGIYQSLNDGSTWKSIGPRSRSLTIDLNYPTTTVYDVTETGNGGPEVGKLTADTSGQWTFATLLFSSSGTFYSLLQDPIHPSNFYVGADDGIWSSTNSGTDWSNSALLNQVVLSLAPR